MTRKVEFCSRRDNLIDLMRRMTDGKFRHLPVIDLVLQAAATAR